MPWLRAVVVGCVFCLATPLALAQAPAGGSKVQAADDEDDLTVQVTEPINPSLAAFKSGAKWGVFGALFMGIWGGLVLGSVIGILTVVGAVLGGLAWGFSGGLVAGAAGGNLVIGLFLGVFLAVVGAVMGLVFGLIAAVFGFIGGAISAALMGSAVFGVIGVLIYVAQQWLGRVPFTDLVPGGGSERHSTPARRHPPENDEHAPAAPR